MKRISILLVALLALFVAACSADQASPSAEESEAVATDEATPAASESASEEPEASASEAALPSFDLNGDPELAARFPDTVAGQPLQVQSFRGDVFMTEGGADESFQAFLTSVGADLEDVSVAFGGVVSGETFISVGAFRVLGVPEDTLEREFLSASEAEGDLSGVTETSLGGKDIWTAEDPSGETGTTAFIYVKDDTVYFLTGTEEHAAEILAALP